MKTRNMNTGKAGKGKRGNEVAKPKVKCGVCHKKTYKTVYENCFVLHLCGNPRCHEKRRQVLLEKCRPFLKVRGALQEPVTPQQATIVVKAMRDSLRNYLMQAPLTEENKKEVVQNVADMVELIFLTSELTKSHFKLNIIKVVDEAFNQRCYPVHTGNEFLLQVYQQVA